MWVVAESDVSSGNPFNWVPIRSAELKINGLQYYITDQESGALWSLCERKTAAAWNQAAVKKQAVAADGNEAVDTVPVFTVIPFAQHVEMLADGESENVSALGVSVANSVVNLTVSLPASLSGNYQFNFSYNFAASLLFSRGGCEYIF